MFGHESPILDTDLLSRRRLGKLPFGLVIGVSCFSCLWAGQADAAASTQPARRPAALKPSELQVLAAFVAERIRGARPDSTVPDLPGLIRPAGPVLVVARRRGIRLASAWAVQGTWADGIIVGLDDILSSLGDAPTAGIDTIELCLTHSYRDIELPRDQRAISNIYRGIRGLDIRHAGAVHRHAPNEMIARNQSFQTVLNNLASEHGLRENEIREPMVKAQIFDAEQILITLGPPVRADAMFRGNIVVPADAVGQQSVRELAGRMGRWLVRQVHDDGRMTYKYWPSRGEESSANNMIRQWMATVCLARWARFQGDQALHPLWRRNLSYNLKHFYRAENDLGLIEFQEKVKLGAVALAALAIREGPFRDQHRDVEESLARTVDALWQEDGSFKTFYKPASRNDNQNFYPGEALLYWAVRYGSGKDPAIFSKFMKSFGYYRDWHLRHRDPAFVPWHTQAYYLLWQETRNPELRDWIFEMNDWLLGMQQWGGQAERFPDIQGRFYDPDHAEYGPPHASSTGVYLEGLIDAYRLAGEVGDKKRVEDYRVAIVRGLRSVMQLEFADDVDMYYISKRDRVRGGLRTTVYDNTIRIDNVQHNLMAIMKILEAFRLEDFRI